MASPGQSRQRLVGAHKMRRAESRVKVMGRCKLFPSVTAETSSMFKRRTLFIIGAGASQEVGFPVGSELAQIIGQKLTPREDGFGGVSNFEDGQIFYELRRHYSNKITDFVQAAWRISGGIRLASSIDDFLNIHDKQPEITLLGKAAIVRAVLEAERKSALFVDPSNIYITNSISAASTALGLSN